MNKIKRKFIMQYFWCWHIPKNILRHIIRYIFEIVLIVITSVPCEVYRHTVCVFWYDFKNHYIHWLQRDYKAAKHIKETGLTEREAAERIKGVDE